MRALVVPIPGWAGHVNPMLGTVEQLVARGVEVGWANDWALGGGPPPVMVPPDVVPLFVPRSTPRLADPPETEYVARNRAQPSPMDSRGFIRTWIRETETDIEPMRRLIRAFKPDVVVVDGIHHAGIIASHLEGVRYACICTGLHYLAPPEFRFDADNAPLPSLKPLLAALFAKHGVPAQFFELYATSPSLNIVFTTPELVGDPDPTLPNIQLVGPTMPTRRRYDAPSDFPWARLRADGRIVYASLGTAIAPDLNLFANLALAAESLDLQLVLRLGKDGDAEAFNEFPGDVIAVAHAPQLELLQKVAVFVTHGGANSVMESLYHGVPMLVVPYYIEQPLQAHFVVKSGTGRAVLPSEASVATLRHALEEISGPTSAARANARRVQASYRMHDGAKESAALIIALTESR